MSVVPVKEREKRIEDFVVEAFSKTTEKDYPEKGRWSIKCPDDIANDVADSLTSYDYMDVIDDQGYMNSGDTGYQWDPIYNAAIRCKQVANVKYADVRVHRKVNALVNEYHLEVLFTQ